MPTETSQQISDLLVRWNTGESEALDHLLPLIYRELRTLASSYLRRERPNHSLQTTDLVHEAFLKLSEKKQIIWQNRQHFFAVAAQMMRRILVDHARQNAAQKRGSGQKPLSLEESLTVSQDGMSGLLALDTALEELAQISPAQAKIVELRFFGGLSGDEVAKVLGVSRRTITRQWRVARARLYHSLTGESIRDDRET